MHACIHLHNMYPHMFVPLICTCSCTGLNARSVWRPLTCCAWSRVRAESLERMIGAVPWHVEVTRRTAHDAFKTHVQQLTADKLKLERDLTAASTSVRVLEQRLEEERADKMMSQIVGQLQEQVKVLRAENADRLGEADERTRQREDRLVQEQEQNRTLRSQLQDARQQAEASGKLCVALQAQLDAAERAEATREKIALDSQHVASQAEPDLHDANVQTEEEELHAVPTQRGGEAQLDSELASLRTQLALATQRLQASEGFEKQYKEAAANKRVMLQRVEAAERAALESALWKRKALESRQQCQHLEHLYRALRDEQEANKAASAAATVDLQRLCQMAKHPLQGSAERTLQSPTLSSHTPERQEGKTRGRMSQATMDSDNSVSAHVSNTDDADSASNSAPTRPLPKTGVQRGTQPQVLRGADAAAQRPVLDAHPVIDAKNSLTHARAEPEKEQVKTEQVAQERAVPPRESEPSNDTISNGVEESADGVDGQQGGKDAKDGKDACGQKDASTAVPAEERRASEAVGSGALDMFSGIVQADMFSGMVPSGIVQGVGKGLPSAEVSWFAPAEAKTGADQNGFFTGLSKGVGGLTTGAQDLTLRLQGFAHQAQGLGSKLHNIQAHAPDVSILDRLSTLKIQTSAEPLPTRVPPQPPQHLENSAPGGSADHHVTTQEHVAPHPQFPPAPEAPSQAKRGGRSKPPRTQDSQGHLHKDDVGNDNHGTDKVGAGHSAVGRPRHAVEVDLQAGRLQGLV